MWTITFHSQTPGERSEANRIRPMRSPSSITE
jgi:hypothetical protein